MVSWVRVACRDWLPPCAWYLWCLTLTQKYQSTFGLPAMKNIMNLLAVILVMANTSCIATDITPDESHWRSYVSQVFGHIIRYQLPGNASEALSPRDVNVMPEGRDFATIFNVGYDYHQASMDLPKFNIHMQVHPFVEDLDDCNFNAFMKSLVDYERTSREGSTNPFTGSIDDWSKVELNGLSSAYFHGEKGASYSFCLDRRHFLRVSATFGRYTTESKEWTLKREALFREVVAKIAISR